MKKFIKSTKRSSRILFFIWLILGIGINTSVNSSSLAWGIMWLLPALIIELRKNPLLPQDNPFIKFIRATKFGSRILFWCWAVLSSLFIIPLNYSPLLILFVVLFLPTFFIEYYTNPVISKKKNTGRLGCCETPSATLQTTTTSIDYTNLLESIRSTNTLIIDQELNDQINQLDFIITRILDLAQDTPQTQTKLSTFLNYYLPTTEKLLKSYVKLDSAGVEGENIRTAKSRIKEGINSCTLGFENILDQLYAADALDIDLDVQVLETMLRRDTATTDEIVLTL